MHFGITYAHYAEMERDNASIHRTANTRTHPQIYAKPQPAENLLAINWNGSRMRGAVGRSRRIGHPAYLIVDTTAPARQINPPSSAGSAIMPQLQGL